MKLKKSYFLCLLLLTTLWACGSGESIPQKVLPHPSPNPSEERKVEVTEVVSKPIAYTVSAVGSLKSLEDVTISSKKSGFIDKILVKEGDRVKKGQILVQLDDVDARLQVEMSEAKVKEAEVSLETDRSTLTRYERLLNSKVIPQQTFDDLNLKVKLDEARLTMAKTELNMARQNLSDHRILSPIEGIVHLKVAALGEHVNVAPKDEILKIVQMDPLEIEFYVPESLAGMVHMGSKIQFSVKAFSEERFFAIIRFISPASDPTTRNVRMKAMVPNPNHRLKPGFFAEVSIQTGGNPAALVIPESSLFSQEGKFFVYTIGDGIAKRKEVTTGVRFEGKVEILQGIQKQERVITSGHEQLSDGMKVVTNKH
ncbi:MAG: efflux RND transporter periplasmic adaptor subunit [Thermodesulfobacteriota bacterium]